MERKQIRDYLGHAFTNLASNVRDLMDKLPDEENGADNDDVFDVLQEMFVSLNSLAGKVVRDVRLRDTKTCQECFNDFNDSGRSQERFCSDECEGKNEAGILGESNEDFE